MGSENLLVPSFFFPFKLGHAMYIICSQKLLLVGRLVSGLAIPFWDKHFQRDDMK